MTRGSSAVKPDPVIACLNKASESFFLDVTCELYLYCLVCKPNCYQ